MTGRGDDTSRVNENVDEARLQEAQALKFRRLNETLVAIRESMERIDLRLKKVKKGNSCTSVSNKGGQNDASQVIDMMTRENLYAEEEYDDGVGMFVPRGSRGRGFGRGIGAGRGRGQIQESYNVARNRGNDEYTDRGLGNIKLKIPMFQGKSNPEAYL